jgi:hypothetical protein
MAASGPIEVFGKGGSTALVQGYIFARGPVKIHAGGIAYLVILSGEDITFDWLSNSLIIARGNVTCHGAIRCHIISAKSVAVKSGKLIDCTVVENERNPLGYIHWAESPIKMGRKVK